MYRKYVRPFTFNDRIGPPNFSFYPGDYHGKTMFQGLQIFYRGRADQIMHRFLQFESNDTISGPFCIANRWIKVIKEKNSLRDTAAIISQDK